MKDLYVVNCCRTAIGSFGGSLKNTPATEMGAIVVKEALKRANVAPENVDELMFGLHPDRRSGPERGPSGLRQGRYPLLRSRLHHRHGLRLRHEVHDRGAALSWPATPTWCLRRH